MYFILVSMIFCAISFVAHKKEGIKRNQCKEPFMIHRVLQWKNSTDQLALTNSGINRNDSEQMNYHVNLAQDGRWGTDREAHPTQLLLIEPAPGKGHLQQPGVLWYRPALSSTSPMSQSLQNMKICCVNPTSLYWQTEIRSLSEGWN